MKIDLIAFVLGFVAGSSPSTELMAATVDVRRLPATDQANVRYLTLYNLPEKERIEAARVLRFWTNSLSTRRRFGNALRISPTLYRLDLRDFGWQAAAWEALAKPEPYFRTPWIDPNAEAELRTATHSVGAVIRADYFIAKTSLEPHYSAFLGLPPTLAELKVTFGIQEDPIKRLSLNTGGSVLASIVALNNRQLERWPALSGYFWQSRDAKSSVGKQNVLGAGENLTAIKNDAGEFIWSLPNGLQAYYLADAAGKQLNDVDPAIAQDTVTAFRSKTVVNARSCVVCHETGLNPFSDVVSTLVNRGKLRLIDTDKDRTLRLEDFYLADVARTLAADQQIYAAAVKACNGLDVAANAKAFEKVVWNYLEARVGADTAARELGIDRLEAIGPKSTDGTVLGLIGGETVGRDAWEAAFSEAAIIASTLTAKAKPQ